MVDPHQISDSLDTGNGVEIQSSPDSTPPSLDRLKLRLETQELSEEQLLNELESLSNAQLDAETVSDLRRMLALGEATPETERFFVTAVSILLAQAAVSGVNLNSATELIDRYRSDPLESNRTLAEAVASLIGKDSTPLGKAFINEYWDKAKTEATDFIQAAEAAESEIDGKESEDADEKSDEEKGIYDKTKDFVKKNKSTIGTFAMIGAIGVGSFYLIRKLFSIKDEGKSEEEKSGFGAKLATAAAVGGFLAGQAIGIKGVQGWIADGNLDSWVYKPWARGWADFVDLEFSNAFDYWTGNGPTSSERSQFESMSKIFDVSESILWTASKVSYGEFMSGDSGTWNPFHKDEEEKLRKSLKDYYQSDLERIMPELKDPEKAKNISLREVLLKGLRAGVIRDKDTTALSSDDREQLAARSEDNERTMQGTAVLLEKPKENVEELQRISSGLQEEIEILQNTGIDSYYRELALSFENLIGMDFDLGVDDVNEYKDLKLAREKFLHAFGDSAKTDKEFFSQKKARLMAFSNFLNTHKDEDPWTESTQSEFVALKEDFQSIQAEVLRAKQESEQENLNKMIEDQQALTPQDAMEGVDFSWRLLSGGLNHLFFRLGAIMEGDVPWIALTIAQSVGVASEFVGVEPPKGKLAFSWRVVKGLAIDPWYKPLLIAKDGRKIFKAFRYTPEELAMDFFKGRLTGNELKTRLGVIKKYESWYKPSWIPFVDDFKSKREMAFDRAMILESEINSLKTIHSYFDGKLDYDALADDTKRAVDLLSDEQKGQVQAYRVLRKVMTVDNRVFDEVFAKLKDPTATLSPKGQLVYDGLNLTDEMKAKLKSTLDSPEDSALLLSELKKVTEIPELQADFLETQTDASGVKTHKYKYASETYSFTEAEIGAKATQIAEDARNSGNVPAGGETAAWHESNWNKAINELSAERYATPVKVAEGKYKFGANTFDVPEKEILARMAADPSLTKEQVARRLCIEQATSLVDIDAVQIEGGKYRYKLNGEWLEFDQPVKPSELKAKFQETLGSRMQDFDTFAAKAKSLKYFKALEKVIGTAGAVYTIYELETASDKRKVTAEIFAGIGSVWAGMKLTDWTIGRKLTGRKRFIVDLLGGISAAIFGAETAESIVMSYYKDIPASYAVSGEVAQIFERLSVRQLSRAGFLSLENGLARKGIEKMGIKGLTSMLEKRISSGFMKKLAVIAAKKGFRDVLALLGVRGVVVAALLADNATLIGVADDIVAVGLGIWMAADVLQILKLIANAKLLQDQMEDRSAYDLRHFEIRGPAARAAFQNRLIPYGCTLENAHEKLDEQTFFDILRGIDDVTLVVARTCDLSVDQRFTGFDKIPHEEWTLHKGEAIGMTLFKGDGSVLCEMTDEDAKVMDEKLTEFEQNSGGEN